MKCNPIFWESVTDENISNYTEIFKKHPWAITMIKNPTEKIYKFAVQCNGNALLYMNNHSEEICLIAVKNHPYSIKHIKNASKKIQITAVTKNGFSLQYIDNPDLDVKIEAMKKDPKVINIIKNKTEDFFIKCYESGVNVTPYIPENEWTPALLEWKLIYKV